MAPATIDLDSAIQQKRQQQARIASNIVQQAQQRVTNKTQYRRQRAQIREQLSRLSEQRAKQRGDEMIADELARAEFVGITKELAELTATANVQHVTGQQNGHQQMTYGTTADWRQTDLQRGPLGHDYPSIGNLTGASSVSIPTS